MNAEPSNPERPVLHTFLAGQSLIDIALQYGVSLSELTEANQLSQQSILFPGQQLIIPILPKPSLAPLIPETHTVITGETIHSIATKYGLAASLLQKINGLGDGAILFPGTVLKLINQNSVELETVSEVFPKHCLIHGYHKVQLGDQIPRIAAFHGVSTQSVLTANNLGWNSIVSPGAKIIIPISHTPLTCPDLVSLSETSKTMAERIVELGTELALREIQIISALCLEMQRSGLQPELGNMSMVEDLIKNIETVESPFSNVFEILNAAGFGDYSTGAARWEPSAWLWLHQIRSNSE
jgi:N-acetylmuramoyl-L-alanine amidase